MKERRMLNIEELSNMPTKRLLIYYKKVRPYYRIYVAGHYCECCGMRNCDFDKFESSEVSKNKKILWEKEINEAEKYLDLIRSVLNTREHIRK